VTYFDTHVLALLYEGDQKFLGAAVRRSIQRDELIASPMAILELEFLHEIGRLKPTAGKVVEALRADLGFRICDLPFHIVADSAIHEPWTRDPFDRLIVANARAADARLATRDERIHRHYPKAIW
jgi:PIN domain nuclease of toxin-antitoxin system